MGGDIEVAVGMKGGRLRGYGVKLLARNGGGCGGWLPGEARRHEVAGL